MHSRKGIGCVKRGRGAREREPPDRQRRLLICLRWQLEMPPNNYKVAYRGWRAGREEGRGEGRGKRERKRE